MTVAVHYNFMFIYWTHDIIVPFLGDHIKWTAFAGHSIYFPAGGLFGCCREDNLSNDFHQLLSALSTY